MKIFHINILFYYLQIKELEFFNSTYFLDITFLDLHF